MVTIDPGAPLPPPEPELLDDELELLELEEELNRAKSENWVVLQVTVLVEVLVEQPVRSFQVEPSYLLITRVLVSTPTTSLSV